MPEPIPGGGGEAPRSKPAVERKVAPKHHPKEGPLPQETVDHKIEYIKKNALLDHEYGAFIGLLQKSTPFDEFPQKLRERVDDATVYVYNAEQARQVIEGLSKSNKRNKFTEEEVKELLEQAKQIEHFDEIDIDPLILILSAYDENNDFRPPLLLIGDRNQLPEQEADEADGDGTPPSPPDGGEPPEGPGLQPQLQTQTDSPREPPRPPTKPPSPPEGPPDEPASLEKEAIRIDPALSRVLVGAVLGKAERFVPDNTTPLTSDERQQLVAAKTDSLNGAFLLAESVSLDSRKSAKSDARTWFDGTKGWVERQKIKRDAQYEDRMSVLQSVGLVNGANEATVEAFYHKYFYDKQTGKAKSDVRQFVQDIAEDCIEDGVVNMGKLEQRLTSVQGLLTAFGKEHRVDLMVRDFATSYGILTQTAETKQRITDEVANNITQALPRDAQERAYLTALSNAFPIETFQIADMREKRESRVNIRIGGKTEPGDRGENQDSIWFDEEKMAGVICDGVGGKAGGAWASKLVQKSMAESYHHMPQFTTRQEAEEWLKLEIKKANITLQAAKDKLAVDDELQDSSTTLTTAFIWIGSNGEKEIITGNIGDSRISMVDGDELRDLTRDQLTYFDGLPEDKVVALQRKFGMITDKSQLTDEERVIWDRRNKIRYSVSGRLSEEGIQINTKKISSNEKIRLIGRSDGLTDVTTNADTLAILQSYEDPQKASEKLIERAEYDDSGSRGKGYADDKSAFVMDITFEEMPATVEIEDFSAEPVTRDDDKLLHILLHPEEGLGIAPQLNEHVPFGERKFWEPEEQRRAEAGMRKLFEVEYGGLPGFDLGTTVMDARRSLGKSPELMAARKRAREEFNGRDIWYQDHHQGWDNIELMKNGGNYLHFGDNRKPPDGTPGKFPTDHRIYVTPKEWAIGEVAAEVILRAREKGYGSEPYGKVWDESSVRKPDDEALSYRGERDSRVDRILFYPSMQAQQDILLSALKDLSQEKPELFEDNPPLITEKVAGIRGVGLAEEPVQGEIVFVDDKKSYTSSRADLLFAVQSELLDTLVGPKSEKTEVVGNRPIDARFVTLRERLADERQADEVRDTMRRLIRKLSPQFGVDPDSFYKNLS